MERTLIPHLSNRLCPLAALIALALAWPSSAHAVQASGTLQLLASKVSGLESGEQITVDVFVRNRSTETPPAALVPAIGFLSGPVTVERLASDECCGGESSDLLRFVPGPNGGCEERGEAVTACTEGADGTITISFFPQGPILPPDGRVLLARLRFENGVAPGQIRPRVNLRATGALSACANPSGFGCIATSIEGSTVIEGAEDEPGFCELHVCGDGIGDEREPCDDGNLVDGDGCDSNCTPTGCGNGVVTSGETCDDGNLLDDDGCDSNCTPTGCGNGIVTSGEACDDANDHPGDDCDACGIGICPAGRSFDGARFRLAKLDGAPSGEDLTFAGRIDCPEGGCEIVDPFRYGLELRIDAPPRGPLVDLTRRTLVVPPAEGVGCDPNDGWRTSSEGRTLIYRNVSGALRSAGCAPESAGGLRRLQITLHQLPVDSDADLPPPPQTEAIAIRFVAQRSSFAAPGGPLRLGIVFTGDPDDALVAPPLCAATSFEAGECRTGGGGELTCR